MIETFVKEKIFIFLISIHKKEYKYTICIVTLKVTLSLLWMLSIFVQRNNILQKGIIF